MCLILLAWRVQPEYPLVLAANRDEDFARAAVPAAWWQQPCILAGRDRVAGGTWLAFAPDGRFAALTNYRAPARRRPDAPTRGALVPQVLAQSRSATEQLEELQRIGARYNDFNLLFSDGLHLAVHESAIARGRLLEPGVYGLSNHLLDTPWPKIVGAKTALAAALTRLPDEQPLLDLLRDATPAQDHELPRTGLTLDWERLLSSAFVRTPTYGTRCSTIALIDRHGQARFTEWTWNPAGELASQVEHHWRSEQASRASATSSEARA